MANLNHFTCPNCGHDFYADNAYATCDACSCFFYAGESRTCQPRSRLRSSTDIPQPVTYYTATAREEPSR
jgi:hypothetical protein